ncbi:hypothetical protein L1049_015214 [Liquidambar formosana]|uniref:mitogen-activated protein kinase kinase kinase n=1 Tax=Liquidambar formosana TaxID=63359 RepID=A0AAP0WZK8_LIQFO
MEAKQRHRKPKLDRRNAIKNIDYDASTSSSSSSSFDNSSSGLRTQFRDRPPFSDRTSFRMEGIEGEFDLICRSLGLSGPEDFAIPTAAWEAQKARSSSDPLPISRLRHSSDQFEPEESPKDDVPVQLIARVRLNDELEHENGCSQSGSRSNLSRVRFSVRRRHDEKVGESNISSSSVTVEQPARNGGGGIKGVRPPVLAPPPIAPPPMQLRSIVDNVSSTWDILKSFGPQEDECLRSPNCPPAVVGSSDDEDESNEENEEVNGGVVERELVNEVTVEEPTLLSESCSCTSNDDDDSLSVIPDPMYSISPNGRFRRSIKSWQKGDLLGSGSFGTVFEGFTDDGFFFAVKEVSLLDQGSQGKQSIYQLEQEISLLSQFEHDNIVQYLGTDKDEAKLYIFLELVTKGSLASLYIKYHLRDTQVSSYTRQILNGLKYLHERNVVHRDIKCANILVHASGYVKLADFGLAKATKLNDVKSCKGTPFWMAPEVVNGRNNGYGLAADIWSLGCTVLEMLTRQLPYSHLEGMQALYRIGKGEPPRVPDSLSSDAQDFIFKCLQVNPNNRPTAAQLLEHPFVKRPLQTSFGPTSPHYNGLQN